MRPTPAVTQEIASKYDIRHMDGCRAANRDENRGWIGFRCQCDFFERVAEHLDEIDMVSAKEKAQALIDDGYYQTSRKYRHLAKIRDAIAGNLRLGYHPDNEEESIEVPAAVFDAFKKLGGSSFSSRAELQRLRRRGEGPLCVDIAFRVPVPSIVWVNKLFDEIKKLWPMSHFLSAQPFRPDVYCTSCQTFWKRSELGPVREKSFVMDPNRPPLGSCPECGANCDVIDPVGADVLR